MSAATYLYLTTTGRRSGRPREIEIWYTPAGGRAYLIAETGRRAHWVRNLLAEPRVRWRIGRVRFAGHARVLDDRRDAALVRAARARSRARYGWGEGLVVELTPRRRRAGR